MSKNQKGGNNKPAATTQATEQEKPVVETKQVVKPEPTKSDIQAGEAVANNEQVDKGVAGKHEEIPEAVIVEEKGVEVQLHPYCETILEYAKTMGPTCQNNPASILMKQMELYQSVTGILNNFEGAEFVLAYGQALDIMAEHKATFTDNLLFRGMNQMRVPPQVRQRYENILVLMSSTAVKEDRKTALESISLDVLCKDFSNEVEQKLKGFYR